LGASGGLDGRNISGVAARAANLRGRAKKGGNLFGHLTLYCGMAAGAGA